MRRRLSIAVSDSKPIRVSPSIAWDSITASNSVDRADPVTNHDARKDDTI